jgi:hypothetical protein
MFEVQLAIALAARVCEDADAETGELILNP